MPMTCSVLGCTARFQNKELNPLRTFHSFPKDEALRRTWLRAIQREDFVPTKYSRLCSDHFREESFDRTSLHYVRLRDGAIPSIFTTVQESLKRKKRQKRKIPKKHEKKQKKKKPRKHDVKVSRPHRTISGSHCLTGELPEPASLVRSEPELPCSLEEGKVKEDLLGMETDEDSLAASDHGLAECVIEKPCILEEVYIKEEPIDESGFETSPHLRTAESNRKQKSSTHDTMEFSSTHEVKEEPLSTEDNKDSFVAKCIKKEACIKEELIIKEEPMDESNMEISPVLRNTVSFTSDGRQPNSSEKDSTTVPAVRHQTLKMGLHGGMDGQTNNAVTSTPRSNAYPQDLWICRKQGRLKSVEAIRYYASINREVTIEMSTDDDNFCVVLITPFMKRAHRELKEAGEVVFTEAIGCADKRNAILLPLLCAGPAGAVPLAMLFMSSKEEASFIKGFGMIKSILGESAFFGRGTPQAFITDNCEAKRNALESMWPDARCFLNIFHIMRQVWSWLVDPNHNVGKNQRQEFMNIFKGLIYTRSTEDFSLKWDAFQNDLAKKYPEFTWYVASLMKKKSEWSISFQGGESLIGHANNFCKATMYVLKEIVRNRCKSYSAAQLIMYMVEIFDVYMQNRLMDVALKQRRLKALIVSKLPVDAVSPLSDGKYRVQNQLDSEELYEVDLSVGTCTCIQGENGAICMHQVTCAEFVMTVVPQKFESPLEYRQWLGVLAVGKHKASELNSLQEHTQMNCTQEQKLENTDDNDRLSKYGFGQASVDSDTRDLNGKEPNINEITEPLQDANSNTQTCIINILP